MENTIVRFSIVQRLGWLGVHMHCAGQIPVMVDGIVFEDDLGGVNIDVLWV